MSPRGIVVLLIALAALALLVALGHRSGSPESVQGSALIPGLDKSLNDIERVTLVKANGETVATLERRPDTWFVTEKSYPADVAKLRQSLRALAQARILEGKTANPELYGRLGVADVAAADATGVAVTLVAQGKDLATLIIGDAQGAKYRYVRRTGEAQSFLIDRNPDFPHNASQWLAATIIDVRGERVQQVTIKHPDGETIVISKPDRAAMNFDVAGVPKGRELLYPGVANVIGNSLRELNLEDVEPAGDAAVEKPVHVEFRTFDGLVVRATGSEREQHAWVAFEASFDAAQAARFAPPQPAPAADAAAAQPGVAADATPSAESAAADGAAPTGSAEDPAAEAQRINGRVSGWRYRVAGFQYDQMTRRMTDLLKPAA